MTNARYGCIKPTATRLRTQLSAHGTFVSPPFKMSRMTWIKPSFLWMMYRAGWGYKDAGQRRILAIDITREGFQWALEHSCPSHPEPFDERGGLEQAEGHFPGADLVGSGTRSPSSATALPRHPDRHWPGGGIASTSIDGYRRSAILQMWRTRSTSWCNSDQLDRARAQITR